MPARITSDVGQLRRRVQGGGEDRLGVVHVPVQRPHPDRPGLRGRRLQGARRRGQGQRHGVLQHAERLEPRRPRSQRDARPRPPEPGARHLLRGLELVRQRLPLPRHHRGGRADVAAGRRAGPPAADALGRAGLDALRPGDHARHAGRHRRERQHRRVRGRRSSRRPSTVDCPPTRVSCSARSPALRARRGTNAENLAPMYKVAATSSAAGYRLIAQDADAVDGHVPERARCARRRARRRTSRPSRSSTCSPRRRTWIRSTFRAPEHARRTGELRAALDGACSTAAVAASRGYKPHVAGSNLASGNVVAGWGMAIGTHNASYAAPSPTSRSTSQDRQGHRPAPVRGAGLGPRRSTPS